MMRMPRGHSLLAAVRFGLLRAAALPLAVGVASCDSSKRSVHFVAASHNLPDPPKAFRGGEDASFFSEYALGTAGESPQMVASSTAALSSPYSADGVGGWADSGVDSGLFSRALMKHTQAYCKERVQHAPDEPVDPQAAVASGLQTMPFLRGSATVTVATLGRVDSVLRVYNIGDSGLQVWRWDPHGALDPLLPLRAGSHAASSMPRTGAWRLVFHSESQQISFNAPLQLAKEAQYSHDINDGVVTTVHVQAGDLVLATVRRDGPFCVGACQPIDPAYCRRMGCWTTSGRLTCSESLVDTPLPRVAFPMCAATAG